MFSFPNFLLLLFLDAYEVSLHPPHLIDSSGSLTPTALIPFCAYQTNMTIVGQKVQDPPFMACSQFYPTVLEGQICYSMNLSTVKTGKTKTGLDSELFMIIDSGRSRDNRESRLDHKHDPFTLSLKPQSDDMSSARIHLNTLTSFTDTRTGTYSLSVLKKITGTKNFKNLPDRFKDCQVEAFEECQTKMYAKEIQDKCDCIPWALGSTLRSSKVIRE